MRHNKMTNVSTQESLITNAPVHKVIIEVRTTKDKLTVWK